jgi:hypothetical protein
MFYQCHSSPSFDLEEVNDESDCNEGQKSAQDEDDDLRN